MATSTLNFSAPLHGAADIELGHQSYRDPGVGSDADVTQPSRTAIKPTERRLQLRITDLLLDSKTLVYRLELFEGQEEDPKSKLDQLVEQPPRSIRIWDYSKGCFDCIQSYRPRKVYFTDLCHACKRLDSAYRSVRGPESRLSSSGNSKLYTNTDGTDLSTILTPAPLTKIPLFDLEELFWPPVKPTKGESRHASMYLPGAERAIVPFRYEVDGELVTRDPIDGLNVDCEYLAEARLCGKKRRSNYYYPIPRLIDI